jgi:uncharacterized protein
LVAVSRARFYFSAVLAWPSLHFSQQGRMLNISEKPAAECTAKTGPSVAVAWIPHPTAAGRAVERFSGGHLRERSGLIVPVLRFLLKIYKLTLSPMLAALTGGPGSGCRFVPTCSEYFVQAVETHGLLIGAWLGAKRILRCHPWGGSGYDPVPARQSKTSN